MVVKRPFSAEPRLSLRDTSQFSIDLYGFQGENRLLRGAGLASEEGSRYAFTGGALPEKRK